MDLSFGPGFYSRTVPQLPPHECLNLYAEADKSRTDRGFVLLRTPGFENYLTVGASPVRAMAHEAGLFSDKIFGLAGDEFFSVDTGGTKTSISTAIEGTENTSLSLAQNGDIVFASGGFVYHSDGATATKLSVDNAKNFRSTFYLDKRFFAVPDDSDTFYFSDLLDGSTWQSLNFLTAEARGDNLLAGVVFRDEAWLFGSSTIEVWATTADADAPLAPRDVVIQKGIVGSTAAVVADQALYWIGDDRVVYRANGYGAEPISPAAINEILSGCTGSQISAAVAWTHHVDGHQFVVWTIPSIPAIVFDASTQEWHRRQSGGQDGYRLSHHVFRSSNHYAGDNITGAIRRVCPSIFTEAGTSVTRKVECFAPTRQYMPCENFVIDCLSGVGNDDSSDPDILLSWSDDKGATFAAATYLQLGAGAQGEYDKRIYATRLGRIRPPGRVFRLEYTEPTDFALYGAHLNERDL